MQARCQVVGDVLLGLYEIPAALDEPLITVVDPIGHEVWRGAAAQRGSVGQLA
jgi:hypothetical protein